MAAYPQTVDAREFAARYPSLFHMADERAWPSIHRHGLLSTKAIVDLYNPPASTRAAILTGRRISTFRLEDEDLGAINIRDQKPLKFLAECLRDGVEPQEFLDALNGRVFFWLSESRLERLLNANEYRGRRQLVLTIDTAKLLATHGSSVELAPYNTGSAHVPPPHTPRRGPDVYVPMASHSFEEWRRMKKGRGEPIVEFTVPYAVPDIAAFVRRLELRQGGEKPIPVDWER